jgi:hypothetical protein
MKRLRILSVLILAACSLFAQAPARAPFQYVWGTAYHVLPGTHNNESGYFSLCEGLDGTIYIGTAKYNENAYLVAFDPWKETQRVVIDTNRVCGLTAKGYAAQSKIHTRNFVGQSGKIYVGSKQGYRSEGDTSEYPGGYVMSYDPRTGVAENLGMPYPTQGVIDVVANEKRKLLYVVTCEDQHWMLGDIETRKYRELGPILMPYATTLIDREGRAHAITRDFQIATHDPVSDTVIVRDIVVGRKKFARPGGTGYAIGCWALAPDGKTAYMTMISYPDLYAIDLSSKGKFVKAINCGKMIDGKNPDSRGSLCIHPDGKVYALWRVDNTTGFGSGYLHHLVRYDPKKRKMEDLGVIAVKNPDFFNFKPGPDGKVPPWSHGYHTLPDGTLTPLYVHMAMIATYDGTLYATFLAPFTLFRIDDYKLPQKPIGISEPTGSARAYFSFVLDACDAVESNLAEIERQAEIVADRHINGGLIGFAPVTYQGFQDELWGRSGGMVNSGFDRPFKQNRTPEEKALDVSLLGWQTKPIVKNEPDQIKQLRTGGMYFIGFGPKSLPELADRVQLCDAWFDTYVCSDTGIVHFTDSNVGGRGTHLVNALNGWAFTAELVSALTRRGKMPTMWKSYAYEDGPAYGEKYLFKKQFHDDLAAPIAPIQKGELARQFLDRIRYHVRAFERTQMPAVEKAVDLICAEMKKGRKTIVASMGHMPWTYVGKYEDAKWCIPLDLHSNIPNQVENYIKKTPDRALVLRLGYCGMDPETREILEKKKQRVILISAENERKGWDVPLNLYGFIDMIYAFGDACVTIEGYPIRILPPSGIMQIVAYEAVNTEVLSRLAVK